MSFSTVPNRWSSVFRPIIFEHEYDTAVYSSVTTASGYAKFNLTLATSLTGIRRIFIADTSSAYYGWHDVTAVTATTITTSTLYTATEIGTLKIIEDTEFEIYVGYTVGYTAENPERIIATIQPTPDLSGHLIFDISEYLIAAWANDGYSPMVAPPVNGIDVNMSTPYRVATLGRSASDGDTYYAAYATINDLSSFDADGIFLSLDTPIVFSCGCTILSQIADTVIYNNIVCDGALSTTQTKLFEDGELFEFQDGEIYEFN